MPEEQAKKHQGLAIASLVLSIVAVLGCLIPIVNLVSCFLAAIAIILGIVAITKKQGSMAIAGVILSVITCVLAFYENHIIHKGINIIGKNLETNLNLEGLEVSDDKLEASGSSSVVTGILTNKTGGKVTMPIINYNAYNSKNELIGSCADAMFGDLEKGAVWEFRAACDTSEEPSKIEFVGATTPVSVRSE